MKVIAATIFLIAGTFSPSLAEVTGEHGLRSLRGSENAGNDHGGAAGAGGGRVLEEDTVGTYLLVRLAKFQGTRVAWADCAMRCASRRTPQLTRDAPFSFETAEHRHSAIWMARC